MNELAPIIHTEYGDIQGAASSLCYRYLGFPYAKPPLGDLRFRHPEKPEPWKGVLPCVEPRDNPLQGANKFHLTERISPDCLYLNVYVPKSAKGKLPVMVWIHGGTYETGGVGASPKIPSGVNYDMDIYSSDTETIVVTLAYRLNLEGFMNLHCLSDRFDLNNGLYDLKMGLEFIHDNIASFGGDPDNVTVFGESAGGALTLALLSSDLTCHLFQKAIVQSACVDHFWTLKQSEKLGRKFFKKTHLKKPEDIINAPWEDLQKVMGKLAFDLQGKGELISLFSPIIDGEFLKEAPREAVKRRTHALMIGTVTHEGDLFVKDLPPILLFLMTVVTPVRAKKGAKRYRHRVSDGLTDYIFRLPAEDIALNYGGASHMFELDNQTPEMRALGCRSFHCADLMPLFHLTFEYGKADDPNVYAVGKMMRRIWGDFAYGRLQDEDYRLSQKKIIINPKLALESKE